MESCPILATKPHVECSSGRKKDRAQCHLLLKKLPVRRRHFGAPESRAIIRRHLFQPTAQILNPNRIENPGTARYRRTKVRHICIFQTGSSVSDTLHAKPYIIKMKDKIIHPKYRPAGGLRSSCCRSRRDWLSPQWRGLDSQ